MKKKNNHQRHEHIVTIEGIIFLVFTIDFHFISIYVQNIISNIRQFWTYCDDPFLCLSLVLSLFLSFYHKNDTHLQTTIWLEFDLKFSFCNSMINLRVVSFLILTILNALKCIESMINFISNFQCHDYLSVDYITCSYIVYVWRNRIAVHQNSIEYQCFDLMSALLVGLRSRHPIEW